MDEANGDIYLIQKIGHLAGHQISVLYWEIDGRVFGKEEKEITFDVGRSDVAVLSSSEEVLHVNVSETAVIGTVIVTVNVTSSDPSTPPLYSFLEPSNRFIIDQYSGDVAIVENLHWKESPYHLVAVASTASAKANVLLVVHVEDVNNNHPVILSTNEVMVFGTGTNRVIHHVVAIDEDYGSHATITFEIISDPSNCFDIDHKTELLFALMKIELVGALSMLRHPSSANSTVVVRASDGGSPALFVDQTIMIRLYDGTKNWRYFSEDEQDVEISDTTPVGTVIKALNLDGTAAIRLFPSTSAFEIDEFGKITLLGTLIPGNYVLYVLAKSLEGDVDALSLTVRVSASTTAAPRISSPSCGSITVPENRVLDDFKQIVPLNASKNSRFRIKGSSKIFDIDPLTGKLSSIPLDREHHSEHLLAIEVYDGQMSDSCSVQITVSDVNDNSPQFSPSTPQVININETVEVRDLIYRFIAFDDDIDSGGSVLFELVEDPSNAFDLNPESGELLFMREPLGVGKDWMIRVKAYDKGRPSLGTDRLLTIQNSRFETERPEMAPSFLRQKYVAMIDEGLTPGQIVSKVATSSRDFRITYSIVEGNTDNAFEIDDDGVVRTLQELDYEIKESYDLKIIATGAFPHQIRTRLLVDVHNVNDNPPVFRPHNKKKILETVPIGSYVTTVVANDADNLGTLEYSLDPNEERFVIDRFTGVIHLLTSLDYEMVEEITVNVLVSDGNFTAKTSVMVLVMDVNDNAPEFQQHFISQSTKAGDVVLKLIAFDRDSGENGRVSYSLADTYGTFHLDSNDGTLTLTTPVTSGIEFLLTVIASDHGFPLMSSTIPVRVLVTKDDELQRRPEFPHSSYEFVVSESTVRNVVFGNVSVSRGVPYIYRIMDPIVSEVFHIDQVGRLTVKAALDREAHEFYSFAIDVGSQSLAYHENSTATVTIRVSDVNDNDPVFNDEEKPVVITDGMRSGEVLRRLKAVDLDAGENGRLSYRIVSGDDYNIFTVESDGGALIFNQLDDEQLMKHTDGKWILYVEASDHGRIPRASILALPIVVELRSWSGTAPFFVIPSYHVVVPENAPIDRPVFIARATNRYGISMKTIRYQLKDNDQTFAIHPIDGSIRLRHRLDFETRTSYQMSLVASDGNARSAVVSLKFMVLPVDEFPPVFTQSVYAFQIPLEAASGTIVGEVHAVDADAGVHGIPEYRIEPPSDLVTVEKSSGVVLLKSKPDGKRNNTVQQITVIAASSYIQQTRAIINLEIGGFLLSTTNSSFSSNIFKIGAASIVVLAVLLVCLLGCCLFGYQSSKFKEVNSPHKQTYSVSRGRNVEISRKGVCRLACSSKQDLPSNIVQKSSSSSSSALSNSALRNSLISHREGTSTRSQPDSGIDQDSASVNSSITDYLISIGVNPNLNLSRPRCFVLVQMCKCVFYRIHRPDTIDSAINEYMYARLDDILPSAQISESADKLEGFYQCSQTRLTAPTFQPLTETLDELEEVESNQNRRREYVQVEI
uniref:Cadherin domain protein n=1 Tax=Angiostrongylus cantonensis TaxID=6313 RepID=A0A158P714_ANGCA